MKNTLACENTKKQKAVSRLEKMLFLQTETLKIFYLTILNNTCKQLKRMKTENLNSCVASLVADASSVEKKQRLEALPPRITQKSASNHDGFSRCNSVVDPMPIVQFGLDSFPRKKISTPCNIKLIFSLYD